jgi:hypothetical protein
VFIHNLSARKVIDEVDRLVQESMDLRLVPHLRLFACVVLRAQTREGWKRSTTSVTAIVFSQTT